MKQNRLPAAENPLRRLALLMDWDGTDYSGWQVQANAKTIQGTLNQALSRVFGEPVQATGCSRTDAGVHACHHVSHVQTKCRIPVERIPVALNTLLPSDLAVRRAAEVDASFHARYGPISKQYSYWFYRGQLRNALVSRYTYQESRPLDLEAMRQVCCLLQGKHDFKAFQAAGAQTKTTVRTLFELRLEQQGELLRFVVRGDGFLYNMVRILAGTLLYVGLGKLEERAILAALESGQRSLVGKTLPARGLFLDRVFYPDDPFEAVPDASRPGVFLGLSSDF